MRILPYVVTRSAHRITVVGSCRRIARRRISQPWRSFRTTAVAQRLPSSEPQESRDRNIVSDEAAIQKLVDEAVKKATAGLDSRVLSSAETPSEDVPGGDRSRGADKKHYGSWRKRAARGTQELQMTVPEWFVNKNIHLATTSATPLTKTALGSRRAAVEAQRLQTESHVQSIQEPSADAVPETNYNAQSKAQIEPESNGAVQLLDGVYQIDKAIMEEIGYMMLGGLRAANSNPSEDMLMSRPHLLLQSPQPKAENFLQHVVTAATASHGIDLIQIDAQDMAAITTILPDVLPEQTVSAVKRLGFDTYVFDEDDPFSESGEEITADHEIEDDTADPQMEDRSRSIPVKMPSINLGNLKPLQHMIQVWMPSRDSKSGPGVNAPKGSVSPNSNFFTSSSGVHPAFPGTQQDFIQAVIRGFIDSPHLKRRKERLRAKDSPLVDNMESSFTEKPRSLVIHIQDYLEISSTSIGNEILDRIHAAVDSKRKEGQPVLIIGTSASEDLFPEAMTESGFRSLQAGNDNDRFRTIVTMCRNEDVESIFAEDSKRRTAQINCRNIQAVLQELYPESSQLSPSLWEPNLSLTTEEMFNFDLTSGVWPLERVQRIASLAHGITENGQQIGSRAIANALEIMDVSDSAKMGWLKSTQDKPLSKIDDIVPTPDPQEEKRKALLKKANRYEKKLTAGVVDANKIRTSFADVHIPPSSIEAVKTLTTLSLIRPDAFAYGVLATDKIPGLLLYGPPGTGKTMLAKAVAKESGSTVLEVSGSEIYDMYVGEGEKNIRAIFSLARKLAPCVVFIDEADAIFGSRSGEVNRRSHRELINQFLKEWDGMNELSAFIMVATNRPFDLDDAVLRRLPRRLLVDLPTEKDREAILRIHLKEESLEANVSLSDLAAQTPFYSGSDLKNVAVAAALACVREENDTAAKHAGPEPYEYPSKRTLTKAHFESALLEISASISEDMSSLKAIRKFDERYGDRRGRRKQSSSLGFGTITEEDKERERIEEGRVRKQELTG